MTEKAKQKKVDKPIDDALSLSQRQTIINRLYGHRSTLRGILNETERMIEWLRKPPNKV